MYACVCACVCVCACACIVCGSSLITRGNLRHTSPGVCGRKYIHSYIHQATVGVHIHTCTRMNVLTTTTYMYYPKTLGTCELTMTDIILL